MHRNEDCYKVVNVHKGGKMYMNVCEWGKIVRLEGSV